MTVSELSIPPTVTSHAPLLSVRDLEVHFPIKKGLLFDRTVGHVKAVDGVSFDIEAGTTFGLVGESGCGKSTLGRAVLRLTQPTAGSIGFDGDDLTSLGAAAMRGRRREMQMIFQDPMASLDPRQSIASILREPMRIHKVEGGPKEWNRRIPELLDQVGLPRTAAARYPHEFSGGQRQRIGIARAIALRPKLIIADEPVSALDVSVQAQVINLLEDLQDELGLTYLVIAHDLAVVRHISDAIAVMYLGAVVEKSDAGTLYREPLHPYTKSLMSAIPVPDPDIEDARTSLLLTGDLPSPANPPTGCRFHTRCPFAQAEKCATERPELTEAAPGHLVSCHYTKQIASGAIKPKIATP